jgi:hypothetical protein
MSLSDVLLCFVFLQLKHLIIDWIWQPAYEHQNKGSFSHPGGYIHAGKNALGTFLVFTYFFGKGHAEFLFIFPIDFAIHFMIDWCKVNINKHYGLDPKVHPEFWWLTGLDQFLHQVTYIYLMYLFVLPIYH